MGAVSKVLIQGICITIKMEMVQTHSCHHKSGHELGDGLAPAALRERGVWIYSPTGRAVMEEEDFTSFEV